MICFYTPQPTREQIQQHRLQHYAVMLEQAKNKKQQTFLQTILTKLQKSKK